MLKWKFTVLNGYTVKEEKSQVFDGKIPHKILASEI